MHILMKKALYAFRNDGFFTSVKRTLLFLRHLLFFKRTYYIYEGDLEVMTREAERPDIEDFTIKILTNTAEFEQLCAEGFLFRPWKPEYRNRLTCGATAHCAFDGKQLIHVSWYADTEKGKRSLGEPPYPVDFAKGEISLGDYWTHPDYRGKNVSHYVTRTRRQYLWDNGKKGTQGSIPVDNMPSRRIVRNGDAQIRALGRHVKILFWQSWRETPDEQ